METPPDAPPTSDSLAVAQLDAIGELARLLENTGIGFWLAGGWAVDFHLGRISRPHSDIDLVVDCDDRPALVDVLDAAGYQRRVAQDVEAVQQFERSRYQVEVTFFTESDDGAVVTPGYEHWPWDEGSFPDSYVTFRGISVRALSVAGLLAAKLGWQQHLGEAPRPHDLADVAALRMLIT